MCSDSIVDYLAVRQRVSLATYNSGPQSSPDKWLELTDIRLAPAGTRWARVRLTATRFGTGTKANDAYFDGLSLRAVVGAPAPAKPR